ncbi:MAG: hypothetical protein EOO75_16420 [Myxococcales bacterium]|nr:MAG: hypothetical protein EOO75_16420 [Myxococcales bacterium]
MNRTMERVRATRPDGKHAYLVYVHGPATLSPLMVMEQPYDGIDWTGEAVDQKWAARGDGLHPDDDAPGYDGDDLTAYHLATPEEAAGQATPHLFNGNAVVLAYGRFYAGGSLEDDIVDATSAYHFALARPGELDASRVAVFGGSWGGMMSLFGASRVPAGVTLRAVVALSPPSDFVDLWDWVTVTGPAVYPDQASFAAFYSPYQRRILAATGGTPAQAPAAWEPYRPGALCGGLAGPTLVLHDTWDVLIPCDQTRALTQACPGAVTPMLWPRPLPIDYAAVKMDHGLFGKEPGLPTPLTFAYLHAHRALRAPSVSAPLYAFLHGEALHELAGLLRAAQLRGEDVSYAAPVLGELCDPRVTALDPVDGSMTKGAAALVTQVNAVWGTTFTETSVCEQLASGLPSP